MLKIAKALAENSDAIFADEPTCNLDNRSIEYITNTLKYYSGSVVVISHDRYFLDEIVNKIWEIENGKITEYWGNYTQYLEQKEQENRTHIRKYEQYVNEKQRLEKIVDEKLKQAQKIKELRPQEKAAMMGLGMMVSLKNIQQMYEDKDIQTKPALNGENNVYPQVFSTVTHGDNVKTLEALEKLGYIQITRKEFKKKSTFAWERLGVGEYKAAQRAFLAKFNPEERKKYEHDFYDMAIQITDKKLNIDELVQRYVNVDQIDKSNRQERKALKTVKKLNFKERKLWNLSDKKQYNFQNNRLIEMNFN